MGGVGEGAGCGGAEGATLWADTLGLNVSSCWKSKSWLICGVPAGKSSVFLFLCLVGSLLRLIESADERRVL